MFKSNKYQQLKLDDPVAALPNYLREIIEKSWAQDFKDYIFPRINEERFSVLYSKKGSRPNSPINIVVGLLILKEYLCQTDEELIGSLHFDIRYQYALNTTSFEKQPVSINTLTNFRRRLYNYEEETGIDLVKEEVETLSSAIADHMHIKGNIERMDSLMVSSNCKKLSRLELVYMTNLNLVKSLKKSDETMIPAEFKCYLEKGHKNETIYRTRNIEVETKLECLLKHSQVLYETLVKSNDELRSLESFLLLERMLKEQTNYEETNTCTPKCGKDITPDSLQNPSDSDATYRKKYGNNTGYVANIVEKFDGENRVITNYDLKENTYDDARFTKDVIDSKSIQEEELTMLVDGGYYSQELSKEAKEKNINLVPGELRGRKPSNSKLEYSSFEIDETENVIKSCPNNIAPYETKYNKFSHKYIAKFEKEECNKCPLKDKCRINKGKKYNTVTFNDSQYQTSVLRSQMNTKEYRKLSNKRSGVEGIPSVLRRKYNVDSVPARGKVRLKLWFGLKIMALNFSRLVKFGSASYIHQCFRKILVNIARYFKYIENFTELGYKKGYFL